MMADKNKQPLIYLSDFLDSKGLKSSERLYYMKTYAAPTVISLDFFQKTSQEWSNITKLK